MSFDFADIGSTAKAIIGAFGKAVDFVLSRQDIIERSGLSKSQVHNGLYRLKQKGLLVNHGNFPDIPRGYWRLRRLFRKIRHCLRIIETRQKQKTRSWNCDCEATSEGYVPYTGSNRPPPPDRPPERITKEYADILTAYLKNSIITTLGKQGIFLTDMETYFERECHPTYFRVPRFCIEGTEWLDDLAADKFEDDTETHEVEIAFKNDVKSLYRWDDTFTVSEDEFA